MPQLASSQLRALVAVAHTGQPPRKGHHVACSPALQVRTVCAAAPLMLGPSTPPPLQWAAVGWSKSGQRRALSGPPARNNAPYALFTSRPLPSPGGGCLESERYGGIRGGGQCVRPPPPVCRGASRGECAWRWGWGRALGCGRGGETGLNGRRAGMVVGAQVASVRRRQQDGGHVLKSSVTRVCRNRKLVQESLHPGHSMNPSRFSALFVTHACCSSLLIVAVRA